MGTVGAGYSMSLDGFIAGPGDDVQQVFAWFFQGDTNVAIESGDTTFQVTEEAAEQMQAASSAIGAIVSGRRTFDVAGAWGGKHPMDVPVVVVTHRVPQEWIKEGSPFTFVTDGVESAVRQAQVLAGGKGVGVAGADITRQCLKAGLLDEISIDLVPVLLGRGVPLFAYLGIEPVDLEIESVQAARGVTHLRYCVKK